MNKHTFSFISIVLGLIGILLTFEIKEFAQPFRYEVAIVFFSAFLGAGITQFIIRKHQETPRFYRKFIEKLDKNYAFYFMFKSDMAKTFENEFHAYKKDQSKFEVKSPSKIYLNSNQIKEIMNYAAAKFLDKIIEESTGKTPTKHEQTPH